MDKATLIYLLMGVLVLCGLGLWVDYLKRRRKELEQQLRRAKRRKAFRAEAVPMEPIREVRSVDPIEPEDGDYLTKWGFEGGDPVEPVVPIRRRDDDDPGPGSPPAIPVEVPAAARGRRPAIRREPIPGPVPRLEGAAHMPSRVLDMIDRLIGYADELREKLISERRTSRLEMARLRDEITYYRRREAIAWIDPILETLQLQDREMSMRELCEAHGLEYDSAEFHRRMTEAMVRGLVRAIREPGAGEWSTRYVISGDAADPETYRREPTMQHDAINLDEFDEDFLAEALLGSVAE